MGNGRATSILCAREGAAVMVADIRAELAQETVDLIRQEGGRAAAVACDASQAEQCRAAVAATVAEYGGLQLLVNVLGISDGQSIFDVDEETFDRSYRVNVRSNLLMMKYAVPEMIAAGGGAIVNVSSFAGLRSGGGIGYTTTKAAQLGLSRSVALAVGKDNIRVNTVLPKTIDTPIQHRAASPEQNAARVAAIPLGRAGTPWEVASAIVFLLSDEAAYISGTELIIDGAASLRSP